MGLEESHMLDGVFAHEGVVITFVQASIIRIRYCNHSSPVIS